MTDYTPEEIEAAAVKLDSPTGDEYGDSSLTWMGLADAYEQADTFPLRGEDVPVTMMEAQPGEEGGPEAIYVIIQVGTQFFKKTGYYASHDGDYWDGDVTEVFQVQRMATFYEPGGK